MFDYRDDIWGVTTSCSFGVVGVNSSVFESGDCGFDEAGFIQGIRVD